MSPGLERTRRILKSNLAFMSMDLIQEFIVQLKHSPPGAVFHPWWQSDGTNDIGPRAPAIRRAQLRAYLCDRMGKARLIVIGEALGYRGGHFSGIPMTSEQILLGKKQAAGIDPAGVFAKIQPRRTSRQDKYPRGFSEPTATMVWSRLLRLGFHPIEFVIWNAFPWHSYNPRVGILSNRAPNKTERSAGLPVLKAFLELFRSDRVVALGKIAGAQLDQLGITARRIRHPASGGARLFKEQIAQL